MDVRAVRLVEAAFVGDGRKGGRGGCGLPAGENPCMICNLDGTTGQSVYMVAGRVDKNAV